MKSSELKNIIGYENAKKLSDYCGGTYIYIPAHIKQDNRDKIITYEFNTLLEEGSTCMNAYQTIAEKKQLTPRRIQQIVSSKI